MLKRLHRGMLKRSGTTGGWVPDRLSLPRRQGGLPSWTNASDQAMTLSARTKYARIAPELGDLLVFRAAGSVRCLGHRCRFNDLFSGDHPDSSVHNVVIQIKGRLEDSETLQQQAQNNTLPQFSASPDLHDEFVAAVITVKGLPGATVLPQVRDR